MDNKEKQIGKYAVNKVAVRLILLHISILLSFFAGCEKTPNQSQEQKPAVSVEVAEVKQEDFIEDISGIGTLKAQKIVEISPELNGTITNIDFEEGHQVEKGDLLVELNDRKLQSQLKSTEAALKQAQSRMEYAQKTYKRFLELLKKGAATQDRLDKARTDFESSQSEVNRLKGQVEFIQEQIKDANIQAPLNGVLGARHVDEGDYIKAGDPVVTLYMNSIMEINFAVPEKYMGRVEPGQSVKIMVDAYPERSFEGTVIYVSPSVDQITRNFPVKASVDNHDNLLKTGAFATALLTVRVLEDRPSIPESALVATTEGYIVYVVEDKTAYQRGVTVGLRKAGKAEITEGLKIGEQVVSQGQMRLSEGDKVIIENKDAKENTSANLTERAVTRNFGGDFSDSVL